MKIKLVANGSRSWERWIKHWGLAFIVDNDILFDTFGNARTLIRNFRRYKVDIKKIGQVAISHEHWDHVKGLRPLLAQRPGLKVHLPQHADKELKYKIHAWGGDVIEVNKPIKLKDGVYLSGEIIGQYAGKDMPEQALVIETKKGLVIVAGCAHPGIMKIVTRVKKSFGKPVYGVIGGFHLKRRTMEDLSIKAARLKAAGVKMIVPLHCTGTKAGQVFREAFGSKCLLLREGQEITL